jgi:hypothetical protein
MWHRAEVLMAKIVGVFATNEKAFPQNWRYRDLITVTDS